MSLSYKRALRVASLQQVLYRFEEQRLVKIQQKLSQLETEIESAVRALNDTNHDTLARAFANRLAGLSREFETAKSDYRNQMRAVATQHGKVKAAQKKLKATAVADELQRSQMELEETIEHMVHSKLTSLP